METAGPMEQIDREAAVDGPAFRFHAAPATDGAAVEQAWQLVYDCYRGSGLIAGNSARIHSVDQAIQRQAVVICGREGEELAATVSCYLDGEGGLPLDLSYADELAALRASGRSLLEVGLLAFRQARSSTRDLFELMTVVYSFATYLGADDIVAGVHPRQVDFYVRLLGFEVAGPERHYAVVQDAAVTLLRLRMDGADRHARLPRGLAYFIAHPVPPAAYDARYLPVHGPGDRPRIARFFADRAEAAPAARQLAC